MMDLMLLRDLETMEKPERKAAIFEAYEPATATPRGGLFAICLVFYLFARPALTRGKRNPCDTGFLAVRLRDRGTASGKHESNDGRGPDADSAPGDNRGPNSIDTPPPAPPRDFSPPKLPGLWNPREESLSLGWLR